MMDTGPVGIVEPRMDRSAVSLKPLKLNMNETLIINQSLLT